MTSREQIQDVNTELGDEISAMLYHASKQTHQNRPGLLEERHESFYGFRAIPMSYFNDTEKLVMNLGFDGVGTKVEVSERLDDHSVVAHDLFAMVCDDAVVRGAEPVAVGSILDVRHLGSPDDEASMSHARRAMRQLADGYITAAKAAGVVVVNGEVAELGDRVGGYDGHPYNLNYNWGAAVLWVGHKDRILTGYELQEGDALVGLQEQGFRSNGITDVRKAMLAEYGDHWQQLVIPKLGDVTLGQLVQRPSAIYSRLVTGLTGGYDIDTPPQAEIGGVAHITGGGQPSKLRRMLAPQELGAEIDNPLPVPDIMLEAQRVLGYSDEKAYSKWHMGPGMVIATSDPEAVIEQSDRFGIHAQAIGRVTLGPEIRVKNMGAVQDETYLTF